MLGVTLQILGTFITEWEAGSILCELLLWTEQSAEAAALQLANIAAFYGFDGWLLNIENPVLHRLIPNLLHFIRWVPECSCLLVFSVSHAKSRRLGRSAGRARPMTDVQYVCCCYSWLHD